MLDPAHHPYAKVKKKKMKKKRSDLDEEEEEEHPYAKVERKRGNTGQEPEVRTIPYSVVDPNLHCFGILILKFASILIQIRAVFSNSYIINFLRKNVVHFIFSKIFFAKYFLSSFYF